MRIVRRRRYGGSGCLTLLLLCAVLNGLGQLFSHPAAWWVLLGLVVVACMAALPHRAKLVVARGLGRWMARLARVLGLGPLLLWLLNRSQASTAPRPPPPPDDPPRPQAFYSDRR